jgi:hypothetical protein
MPASRSRIGSAFALRNFVNDPICGDFAVTVSDPAEYCARCVKGFTHKTDGRIVERTIARRQKRHGGVRGPSPP